MTIETVEVSIGNLWKEFLRIYEKDPNCPFSDWALNVLILTVIHKKGQENPENPTTEILKFFGFKDLGSLLAVEMKLREKVSLIFKAFSEANEEIKSYIKEFSDKVNSEVSENKSQSVH